MQASGWQGAVCGVQCGASGQRGVDDRSTLDPSWTHRGPRVPDPPTLESIIEWKRSSYDNEALKVQLRAEMQQSNQAEQQKTQLLSATQRDDAEAVQKHLDAGIPATYSNSVGQTALHIASLWGNSKVGRDPWRTRGGS